MLSNGGLWTRGPPCFVNFSLLTPKTCCILGRSSTSPQSIICRHFTVLSRHSIPHTTSMPTLRWAGAWRRIQPFMGTFGILIVIGRILIMGRPWVGSLLDFGWHCTANGGRDLLLVIWVAVEECRRISIDRFRLRIWHQLTRKEHFVNDFV